MDLLALGGRHVEGGVSAVEYYDPSAVFPLISSGLLARLPLRSLHWKSTTRPLRSISSLHVDLVPHERPRSLPLSSASTTDVPTSSKGRESNESREDGGTRPRIHDRAWTEPKTTPDAGAGTFQGPLKERRHQIPGLRQTPYLKIYLLRCDDNETYKATARKVLREWIKTITPSSSTAGPNAQENHDAFEWLIVHVLLPSSFTTPSTQGPGGQAVGSGTAAEKQGSTSRWPGKGSTTVLEKIRADFNGSSKSSLDRVAQLRLHETDIPPHLLPSSFGSTDARSDEGQQDHEAAWSGLISKFRSLILTSFDRRVGQYEEDIRQRDAQRHLPGWNFCTFFILKEGLARGFGSVGLLEDALVGYDELAAGLDMVARESVSEEGQIRGSTFLQYTEDLRRRAEAARAFEYRRRLHGDDADDKEQIPDAIIVLDDTNKKYRDLILSNQISLFDFRSYLFARQRSLLLRQANAWLSSADLRSKLKAENEMYDRRDSLDVYDHRYTPPGKATSSEDQEDLTVLAELSKRAVELLPTVARLMRADLWSGLQQSGDAETEENSQIVDNLVSSWTFAVSRQILAETASKVLILPPSVLDEGHMPNVKELPHGGKGSEPKMAMTEPKTIIHPGRQGSLTAHNEPRADRSIPDIIHPAPQSRPYAATSEPSRSGMEELAHYRAELYLFERSALKRLGSAHGWSADLGALYEVDLDASRLEDVSLEDDHSWAAKGKDPMERVPLAGIDDGLLRTALESEERFYRLYEVRPPDVDLPADCFPNSSHLDPLRSDLEALHRCPEDRISRGDIGGSGGLEVVRNRQAQGLWLMLISFLQSTRRLRKGRLLFRSTGTAVHRERLGLGRDLDAPDPRQMSQRARPQAGLDPCPSRTCCQSHDGRETGLLTTPRRPSYRCIILRLRSLYDRPSRRRCSPCRRLSDPTFGVLAGASL